MTGRGRGATETIFPALACSTPGGLHSINMATTAPQGCSRRAARTASMNSWLKDHEGPHPPAARIRVGVTHSTNPSLSEPPS